MDQHEHGIDHGVSEAEGGGSEAVEDVWLHTGVVLRGLLHQQPVLLHVLRNSQLCCRVCAAQHTASGIAGPCLGSQDCGQIFSVDQVLQLRSHQPPALLPGQTTNDGVNTVAAVT